jgi:nucleotide-binding universal stress UspA family protein
VIGLSALGLHLSAFTADPIRSPLGKLTMNIKQILIATDFSECSNTALDFASRLASDTKARLHIVHVDGIVDISVPAIPPTEPGYYYDAPWGHERHEIRERLIHTVPTIDNVAYEHHYLTGLPVAQILKLAEHEHIDLIVLGSHGRSGFSRLLMGSVAEGVVRDSTCPVLVVKHSAKQPSPENTAFVADIRE